MSASIFYNLSEIKQLFIAHADYEQRCTAGKDNLYPYIHNQINKECQNMWTHFFKG